MKSLLVSSSALGYMWQLKGFFLPLLKVRIAEVLIVVFCFVHTLRCSGKQWTVVPDERLLCPLQQHQGGSEPAGLRPLLPAVTGSPPPPPRALAFTLLSPRPASLAFPCMKVTGILQEGSSWSSSPASQVSWRAATGKGT